MIKIEIIVTKNESTIILRLTGRLDTLRSPAAQKALGESLGTSAQTVILDFAGVDYVSSAGLRVLLRGEKASKAAGKTMKLKNISPDVLEVFDITGFTGILNIE